VAGIPHSALNDVPVTHDRIRAIRSLVDGYPGQRVVVGEVYLLSTDAVATYYGDGDELHLAFNFPPLYARWEADAWAGCIDATTAALDPRGAWPTWVLSNHDNPRHRTRYDRAAGHLGEEEPTRERRSEARARAAAVLLLTLRGTPFVYQGEELGLLDAVIPIDRAVDPGGRDGCRAPIPWDGSDDHGWTVTGGAEPWLPFPPDPGARNHDALKRDPSSILHLYRRLLALRHEEPALRTGGFERMTVPEGLVGYRRFSSGRTWLVLINFTDREIAVSGGLAVAGDGEGARDSDGDSVPAGSEPAGPGGSATGRWDDLSVEVASDGLGEHLPFGGIVGADQALILRG
jgi:alpha-glucosidase